MQSTVVGMYIRRPGGMIIPTQYLQAIRNLRGCEAESMAIQWNLRSFTRRLSLPVRRIGRGRGPPCDEQTLKYVRTFQVQTWVSSQACHRLPVFFSSSFPSPPLRALTPSPLLRVRISVGVFQFAPLDTSQRELFFGTFRPIHPRLLRIQSDAIKTRIAISQN